MNRHLVIASLALVGLSGCTSFGTNVRGSFNCSAPNGTCAPSTVIDDQALALIANDSGALRPAGPFERGPQAPAVSVARAAPQAAAPRRTLAIRIMPRIDELGVQHDAHLVHVALPGPAPASALASLPVAATARPVAVAAAESPVRLAPPSREEIIRQALSAPPRATSPKPDVRPVSLTTPVASSASAAVPGVPITLPRPLALPPVQLSDAGPPRGTGPGPAAPTTAAPPPPARVSPPTVFSTDN